MRVRVTKDTCCGSGQCAMTAPSVFTQDDEDGTVVVLDEQPPEHLYTSVREAADGCPTGTISLQAG